MNSATANAIDKLKDANKDYIWRDGMTAGAPPSLLGRPVEFDENMPSIGAGNYPIAFGDFRVGYLIVDKGGIRYFARPVQRQAVRSLLRLPARWQVVKDQHLGT